MKLSQDSECCHSRSSACPSPPGSLSPSERACSVPGHSSRRDPRAHRIPQVPEEGRLPRPGRAICANPGHTGGQLSHRASRAAGRAGASPQSQHQHCSLGQTERLAAGAGWAQLLWKTPFLAKPTTNNF